MKGIEYLIQLDEQIVEGVFLNEIKNRFLCNVCIDGIIHECYVPSSSRLDNYIKLKNKKVLLTINKGKDIRTKYSIFAVKYRNKYIMLNLHYANKLFELKLREGQCDEYYKPGTCKREVNIEGHKADFLYEGLEKTIIENKAIINISKEVYFPGTYAKRGIEQLKKLLVLLEKGYKVNYNLISLSPFVEIVKINPAISEFCDIFLKCIRNGMQVHGYCLYLMNSNMEIGSHKIKVLIED